MQLLSIRARIGIKAKRTVIRRKPGRGRVNVGGESDARWKLRLTLMPPRG